MQAGRINNSFNFHQRRQLNLNYSLQNGPQRFREKKQKKGQEEKQKKESLQERWQTKNHEGLTLSKFSLLTTNNFLFETINEKGIPIKDDTGNRQLYTRRDGLSRFSLYWYRYSNVNSYDRDLADSYDNGQVVVLDAEGVALKNALNRYSARRK